MLTSNHNEQLAQNTNKQLVGEMFELLSKGSYLGILDSFEYD